MAQVLKTCGRKPSEVRTLYSPPRRGRLVVYGRSLLNSHKVKLIAGSNPAPSAIISNPLAGVDINCQSWNLNLPERRRSRGAVRGDSAESTEDFESRPLRTIFFEKPRTLQTPLAKSKQLSPLSKDSSRTKKKFR